MRLTALFHYRTWLAIGLLMFLTACSPKYDWREVRGDSGAVALFPAKPKVAMREVDLDGVSVNMSMQLARVDELGFALGWADLPAGPVDQDVARTQALAAMRTALVRNLEGRVVSDVTVAVARTERGAAPLTGAALAIAGAPNGTELRMDAILAGQGSRIWQVVVYGPQAALNAPRGQQAAETFLMSVRVN